MHLHFGRPAGPDPETAPQPEPEPVIGARAAGSMSPSRSRVTPEGEPDDAVQPIDVGAAAGRAAERRRAPTGRRRRVRHR